MILRLRQTLPCLLWVYPNRDTKSPIGFPIWLLGWKPMKKPLVVTADTATAAERLTGETRSALERLRTDMVRRDNILIVAIPGGHAGCGAVHSPERPLCPACPPGVFSLLEAPITLSSVSLTAMSLPARFGRVSMFCVMGYSSLQVVRGTDSGIGWAFSAMISDNCFLQAVPQFHRQFHYDAQHPSQRRRRCASQTAMCSGNGLDRILILQKFKRYNQSRVQYQNALERPVLPAWRC